MSGQYLKKRTHKARILSTTHIDFHSVHYAMWFKKGYGNSFLIENWMAAIFDFPRYAAKQLVDWLACWSEAVISVVGWQWMTGCQWSAVLSVG